MDKLRPEFGLKPSETDRNRNGQKSRKMDRNGQKQTETQRN